MSRPREHQYCGKVPYDKAGAIRALVKLKQRRHGGMTERRHYWCQQCRAYHLTKMDGN
ncbi:MAG: hypothetical protein AB1450_05000 [Pseudomonadota bacterium]|jgi:hypothetical protein